MIKTLTKHGNSYALVIDRAVLELLGIQPDTPLKIATDGQSLVISPVREPVPEQDRVQLALERVNKRHGGALRRLAQ